MKNERQLSPISKEPSGFCRKPKTQRFSKTLFAGIAALTLAACSHERAKPEDFGSEQPTWQEDIPPAPPLIVPSDSVRDDEL
jgi:hypothetical protein